MPGRDVPLAAPDVALYMYRVLREDTVGAGGSSFAVESAIVGELASDLRRSLDATSSAERPSIEHVVASAEQLRDAMAAADAAMAAEAAREADERR